LAIVAFLFSEGCGMAKKTRPIADDGALSGPAQPRAGRRMTGRQPASGHAAPGSSQDVSQGAPDADVAQGYGDVAQDFSPAQYQSTPPEPSEHEIRLRAYHRYLDRGAFDGADFDDWLQAEMELKKR
jgi:hypothetical protein